MKSRMLNIDVGEKDLVGVECGAMTFDNGDLILYSGPSLDSGIAAAFAAGVWRKVWWDGE